MDMIVIGALLGLLIEISICFFDLSKYENIQKTVSEKLEELKGNKEAKDVKATTSVSR